MATPITTFRSVRVWPGNLYVGKGVPDTELNGGDVHIEGTLEVDGALNIDGAWALGNTLTVGEDGTGYDVIFYGDTAGSYFHYDADTCSLLLPGAISKFKLGALASVTGSGSALDATNSAAFRVYADDGGAAIGSGTLARAGEFRNLLTYTAGNREQEAAGVVGKLVSVAGTNRHNMCGVLGSYESSTSLIVDGQAATTDTWCQAAIIGRVGGALITVNTNAVLAGVAAMSNVATALAANSGIYTGLYVGKWASTETWSHGLYIQHNAVDKAIQVGELSSTTQTGIHLTSTNPNVIDSFADDNNVTLGDANYANIRARTMLFKACTAGTIISVKGQLKFADEADMGPGVFAGVQGYMEAYKDMDVKSGGKFWAVDASIDVPTTGTFTVVSGGIAAGLHAEITGAGTFVQDSGGILAGLYIDEQATVGNWGYGVYVTGAIISLAALSTLTPDSTRSYAGLVVGGSRATAGTVTMAASTSQHLDPIQLNLGIAGSAPTSTSTVNGFYQLITHATTDMANYLRIKGCDWTLDVRKHLQDAYVIQGELDIQTNSVTVGGEACALGLMTSVTSAVTGNVWNTVMAFSTDQTMASAAILFLSARSTGTIGHGLYIEANSGTTLTDAIYINPAGTITNLFKFASASGPVSVDAGATGANSTHKIKIDIGGVAGYIAVFADY